MTISPSKTKGCILGQLGNIVVNNSCRISGAIRVLDKGCPVYILDAAVTLAIMAVAILMSGLVHMHL